MSGADAVARPLRNTSSLSRPRNVSWAHFDSLNCASKKGARRDIMVNAIARFRALLRNDEGQDLIEYALLAGLIALVAVGAITTAGTEVDAIWDNIVTALQNVP
jgi:pilus assembly protein Flp/PilA